MSDSSGEDQEGSKLDKLDIIIKEITDLKKYTKKKLEECNRNILKISENQNVLQKEIATLNQKVVKQSDVIKDLQNKVIYLERASVECSLNLSPIPKAKKENLREIVVNIGKKLKIPLGSNEVAKVYRRKDRSDGKPGDVIIKCTSQMIKEKVLAEFKNKNPTFFDLGFSESTSRVYANQELIPSDKVNYSLAIKKKKEGILKYAWVSNGAVLVRQREGEPAIRITSKEQITDFIGN